MGRLTPSLYIVLFPLVLIDCKYEPASDDTSSGGGNACLSFFACGGDPTGTWNVSTLCFNGDLNAELFAETNLPADCSLLFQNATLTGTGTLTYANGAETLNIAATISVTAQYTEPCLSAVTGQNSTMDLTTCSELQNQWANQINVKSASCSLIGTTCRCSITETKPLDSVNDYTISGNSLEYVKGDSADYCVSGASMTLRKQGLLGTLTGVISASQ